MVDITISYYRLLNQLNNILNKTGYSLEDDISLIVVRGYPIKDYVPIVDFWFNDVIIGRTIDILDEEDNQEILPIKWLYKELNEMNGKTITIDEGFNDLDLFVKLIIDRDIDYSMMSVSFLDKVYPGLFDEDFDYYESYGSEEFDEFRFKANEMCKYLDNVDNLVLNEKNHEIAFQLAKRLLRLMR